jgi:hypothetical protein
MSRVEPKAIEDLADLGPMFDTVKAAMGFVPNSMLTMARRRSKRCPGGMPSRWRTSTGIGKHAPTAT